MIRDSLFKKKLCIGQSMAGYTRIYRDITPIGRVFFYNEKVLKWISGVGSCWCEHIFQKLYDSMNNEKWNSNAYFCFCSLFVYWTHILGGTNCSPDNISSYIVDVVDLYQPQSFQVCGNRFGDDILSFVLPPRSFNSSPLKNGGTGSRSLPIGSR